MSRTLTAGHTAHLAGTAHTRSTLLRLDLVDGTTLAITDHSQDIAFDLGDGSVTYSAETGILPSDLSLSTGFDADDIEVQGPIGDTVTRTAVLGGRYDDAVARLFQVNWDSLADGPIRLMRGRVVLASVEGGRFKLTIHSDVSRFAQEIGRTITAYCDADFGDARCGFDVVPVSATVTSVTDERVFTVSFSGSFADDFFNRGTVSFLTGALAGTRRVEIFDWSSAGQIALWTDLPEPPEVGDTLQLRQGCSKVRSSDDPAQPTCMTYDNIINFRGFPDVPGSDQVLRYPNPGGG
jgi:uncharacterized phage protein (TIGR02218 family)